MSRIRIKYKKNARAGLHISEACGGLPLLIGHLDMVRVWERALRRTEIPVAYTEGFNPRQKLSFGPPLSLGVSSECELLDIYLEQWTNPQTIMAQLNKTLPQGIEIIEAKNVFSGLPSLTASIKTAEYTAEYAGNIQNRIEEIMNSKEITVKRGEKELNIRPYILECSAIPAQDSNLLRISVRCASDGSVKAKEIINMFPLANLRNLKRVSFG